MNIFATDYDGTLFFFDEDPCLRIRDKEAIEKFQQEGNLFGLCTGRPAYFWKQMNEKDLKKQVHFDFRIFSNGALVLDENDNVIIEHFIPDEFVRYALEKWPDAPFVWHLAKDSPFSNKKPETFAQIAKENIPLKVYGLSFDHRTPLGKKLMADLNAQPGVVGYSNPAFHDMMAQGVSKGRTFLEVARSLGFEPEQSAAMGDSYNDVDMIQRAATGFTFSNAPEDIRQQADVIVDSLGQALEYLMNCNRHNEVLSLSKGDQV